MTSIIISILIILFVLFLIWAYRPDYKRDPEEFLRTIIGMPIGIVCSFFGLTQLNEKIKNWVLTKKERNNNH